MGTDTARCRVACPRLKRRKRPYFKNFTDQQMDRQTDGWTNQRTNRHNSIKSLTTAAKRYLAKQLLLKERSYCMYPYDNSNISTKKYARVALEESEKCWRGRGK